MSNVMMENLINEIKMYIQYVYQGVLWFKIVYCLTVCMLNLVIWNNSVIINYCIEDWDLLER